MFVSAAAVSALADAAPSASSRPDGAPDKGSVEPGACPAPTTKDGISVADPFPSGDKEVPETTAHPALIADRREGTVPPEVNGGRGDVLPKDDDRVAGDATEGLVEPPERATHAHEARASDLTELPGAGPGLVWMLEQCGVRSLEAMAQADPEALTARMGLVGEMLDLSSWVAHAAETMASRTAEPQSDT